MRHIELPWLKSKALNVLRGDASTHRLPILRSIWELSSFARGYWFDSRTIFTQGFEMAVSQLSKLTHPGIEPDIFTRVKDVDKMEYGI